MARFKQSYIEEFECLKTNEVLIKEVDIKAKQVKAKEKLYIGKK